jgi:hypothetical protein
MPTTAPAFPNRPLTVRPPGYSLWALTGWVVVGAFMMLGFWLIVTEPIPALKDDWVIRNTARPIPQAGIEDGRCSTRLVLVQCEATLTAAFATGEVRKKTKQYFVAFHIGDYSATVMGDPARPEYLTTDLALSKFWNRVITLLVSIPVFAALAGLMVWYVVRQLRERRSILRGLNGRTLRLVALELGFRNRQIWRVGGTNSDGSPAWQDWHISPRRSPIVLDAEQGLVLGVTADNTRVVMPLDTRLSWIGLTDAERETLRRSLSTAPTRGGSPAPAS